MFGRALLPAGLAYRLLLSNSLRPNVRSFGATCALCGDKRPKIGNPFLSGRLTNAARGVGKAFGSFDIVGDLLGKLQKVSDDNKRESVDLPRLRNVLSDMTIEMPRTVRPPRTEGLPAHFTKASQRGMRKPRPADSWTDLKSLFEGQPLGIFTKEDLQVQLETTQTKKCLFDELVEDETRQMVRTFPRNAFEEQIQWTEDGKLWQFPVDNEIGWPEENSTSFVEHIFIEQLLDHPAYNFPKEGPVRHFMELVCNGLSKNAFMSAKEKREIVEWFDRYFRDKYAIVERAVAESEKLKAKEAAIAAAADQS